MPIPRPNPFRRIHAQSLRFITDPFSHWPTSRNTHNRRTNSGAVLAVAPATGSCLLIPSAAEERLLRPPALLETAPFRSHFKALLGRKW